VPPLTPENTFSPNSNPPLPMVTPETNTRLFFFRGDQSRHFKFLVLFPPFHLIFVVVALFPVPLKRGHGPFLHDPVRLVVFSFFFVLLVVSPFVDIRKG